MLFCWLFFVNAIMSCLLGLHWGDWRGVVCWIFVIYCCYVCFDHCISTKETGELNLRPKRLAALVWVKWHAASLSCPDFVSLKTKAEEFVTVSVDFHVRSLLVKQYFWETRGFGWEPDTPISVWYIRSSSGTRKYDRRPHNSILGYCRSDHDFQWGLGLTQSDSRRAMFFLDWQHGS